MKGRGPGDPGGAAGRCCRAGLGVNLTEQGRMRDYVPETAQFALSAYESAAVAAAVEAVRYLLRRMLLAEMQGFVRMLQKEKEREREEMSAVTQGRRRRHHLDLVVMDSPEAMYQSRMSGKN